MIEKGEMIAPCVDGRVDLLAWSCDGILKVILQFIAVIVFNYLLL